MLETDKTILGKKIREFRKNRKMTQFELAEAVGLNEKQISRIEAGQNYPTYMTFVKLLEALEIDVLEFKKDISLDINPSLKEIKRILKNSDDFQLKIYSDVLKSLNKNLAKKYSK